MSYEIVPGRRLPTDMAKEIGDLIDGVLHAAVRVESAIEYGRDERPHQEAFKRAASQLADKFGIEFKYQVED